MGMTETLKALSDPVRREILNILKGGQRSAGDISARFELTDATISHHLSVLKNAGLIDSTRNGTFIVYELNTSLFEEVAAWLMNFKGGNPS
jgi:DNA-binding transcriptional ArsR family regulator